MQKNQAKQRVIRRNIRMGSPFGSLTQRLAAEVHVIACHLGSWRREADDHCMFRVQFSHRESRGAEGQLRVLKDQIPYVLLCIRHQQAGCFTAHNPQSGSVSTAASKTIIIFRIVFRTLGISRNSEAKVVFLSSATDKRFSSNVLLCVDYLMRKTKRRDICLN